MLGSHVHLDISDFLDEVVRYLIFLSVQSSSVLLMNTEVTKQMIYWLNGSTAYQIYPLESHLGHVRRSAHQDLYDVSPSEGQVVTRSVDGSAEVLQLRIQLLDAEKLRLLQHSCMNENIGAPHNVSPLMSVVYN